VGYLLGILEVSQEEYDVPKVAYPEITESRPDGAVAVERVSLEKFEQYHFFFLALSKFRR